MGATALIFKVLAHLLPFLKEALLGGTRWDVFIRRNKCAILLAIVTIVFIVIYGAMLDATMYLTKKMTTYKETTETQAKEIVELKHQLELKPKTITITQCTVPMLTGQKPTHTYTKATPVYIVPAKKSIKERLSNLP